MNGARNLLNQAKNSVAALDIKFKAAMISVCEQTSRYNFLKAQAEKCKDKYDTLHQAQELITDASLLEITSAHANAMTQFAFNEEEEEAEAQASAEMQYNDDGDNPYGKSEARSSNDIEDVEDTEMQQVATKRNLPMQLNLTSDNSMEEIMTSFNELSAAKKAKSTPRGDGEGE